MKFFSTQNPDLQSNLKDAVLHGLAPDRGLYMPEEIPILPDDFWEKLPGKEMAQIGLEVLSPYFSPEIPYPLLARMIQEAFDFPVPVAAINDRICVLELFHGPTLAFKDVGARFLARIMGYFADYGQHQVHVLAATSGDTGSAVANGFLGVPGVQVHILYPSGLVSPLQELQFTTLGSNVHAYEVEGTFDDCQRLVKQVFMDETLREQLVLTSANSINLARFLPQAVYYFYALAQIPRADWHNLVVAVPSGNFGNLTAGVVALKMGLPIKRFIAATNANDVFVKYLQTGMYEPKASVATVANAMDVGDPSNFDRIVRLFPNLEAMNHYISAQSFSDEAIGACVSKVFGDEGYLLDPHGATGYAALHHALEPGEKGLFLATAHPAKFEATVSGMIGQHVELPPQLAKFLLRSKKSVKICADFNVLKSKLLHQFAESGGQVHV